jgi:CRISPR-associated protein Csm3
VANTRECTRLIFRDCPITPESAKQLADALPGLFVEVKTEIAMDRNRGATTSGSLRQQERVPGGTEFRFEVVLRVFEGDDVKAHLSRLAEAIDLLEKEYLGGSGTRGYGKVRFLTADGKEPLAPRIRQIVPDKP